MPSAVVCSVSSGCLIRKCTENNVGVRGNREVWESSWGTSALSVGYGGQVWGLEL